MLKSLSFALLISVALLAACSKRDEEKPAGVIPPYQQKALEQAKAVESTLNTAEEQRQQTLDQMEGEPTNK